MYARSLFAVVLLLIGSPVRAQIMNGTFDAQGVGWSISAPPGWNIAFPASGGNPGGYASIETPASHPGGIACLFQTFECGPPDTTGICNVYFDFRVHLIGGNPNTARLTVTIDGDQYMQLTYYPSAENWSGPTGGFGLYCGTHTLGLCLEVDPGDNHFVLCYDNASAVSECDVVDVEGATWGDVKALFR